VKKAWIEAGAFFIQIEIHLFGCRRSAVAHWQNLGVPWSRPRRSRTCLQDHSRYQPQRSEALTVGRARRIIKEGTARHLRDLKSGRMKRWGRSRQDEAPPASLGY
jgi:hypothetical protein